MEQQHHSSDDISLQSFKDSVYQFLLLIFSFIKGSIAFIKKHFKTFLVYILIFGAAGTGFSLINKKTYKLRMTVVSTEFSRRIYSEQFVKLDKLIKTNSIQQLNRELKSNDDISKKLRAITCFDIYDEPLESDTSTKEREPFVVEVNVIDNSIADSLQNMLLNYINSNPYLTERKKVQYKIFEDKLRFVESEQRKLDSLKAEYNLFMNSSGNKAMFYNNAFNPSDLYAKSNEYQYQKDQINSWFGFEQLPLRVIDGFKPARKADSLSTTGIILLSLFAGAFIGFIVSGYKELDTAGKQTT